MTEKMINNKPTAPGNKVKYTGHDRLVREAILDDVDDQGNASLSSTDRAGQPQKHTAVPHSADGGPHTWNHSE